MNSIKAIHYKLDYKDITKWFFILKSSLKLIYKIN